MVCLRLFLMQETLALQWQTSSCFSPFFTVPGPVTFPSSTYLGRPTIGYVVAGIAAPDTDKVKLYCQVSLLKGIEFWKNVTYRIQWYSEGTLIDNAAPFCLPKSGQSENDKSCPGSGRRKEIRSQLSNFEPGQRVSH